MKRLVVEEMQQVIAGGWFWKPNLDQIPISGGNTCMDVYNYYGGDADYAASHLMATGGSWVVSTCLDWVGGQTD